MCLNLVFPGTTGNLLIALFSPQLDLLAHALPLPTREIPGFH